MKNPVPTYSPFPTAAFDLPAWQRPAGGTERANLHGDKFDMQRANFLKPMRTYAIAATERSGSTLLCRHLALTGLLGLPANYVHIEWEREILKRGVPGETILQTLYRLRTTPNGCFGIKFHSLQAFFGNSAFEQWQPDVWLQTLRADKLAQAISWSIASQTNSWWSHHPEQWEPQYDFNNILNIMRQLKYNEDGWSRYLDGVDAPVMQVHYEEKPMPIVVIQALKMIRPNMGPVHHFAFPELEKQRGERSMQWAEKFLVDCGRYSIKAESTWGSDLLDPQLKLPEQVICPRCDGKKEVFIKANGQDDLVLIPCPECITSKPPQTVHDDHCEKGDAI